jgi:NADH:ubiquinone oxidoreductase subunit 6 (subunit J)
MDNIDIIIYTGIVVVAFISFSIMTFKELSDIEEKGEDSIKKK